MEVAANDGHGREAVLPERFNQARLVAVAGEHDQCPSFREENQRQACGEAFDDIRTAPRHVGLRSRLAAVEGRIECHQVELFSVHWREQVALEDPDLLLQVVDEDIGPSAPRSRGAHVHAQNVVPLAGGEDGRDAGTRAHVEGVGRCIGGCMRRRQFGNCPGEEPACAEDDRIVHSGQDGQRDPIDPSQSRAVELPEEERPLQPQPEQGQKADQLNTSCHLFDRSRSTNHISKSRDAKASVMTELTPRPTAVREDADDRLPLLPRRDPVLELPLLILYPHSRCNCRCIMCDIWRTTTKDEISTEDVRRWLPEWERLGVRRVVLSGGEPLMHSSFWDLCDVLAGAGIGLTVLSTGLLLRRDPERLVQYCDDVVVSLDGPREVHNQIRNIPRAYEKLAEGVAAVRGTGGAVSVSGRCTVQRQNFRTLRATVEAARELALDRISFLAADVSTDAFNRPEAWDAERSAGVALSEDDLPPLRAELEAMERECQREFAAGFVVESPDKLRRRILQYYEALAGRGDFSPIECNAPWVSSVIEADGTVRPCFFQPPLGNVFDAPSFSAILNSEEAVAWRQGLDTTRNAICRKCVCSLALRESDPNLAR